MRPDGQNHLSKNDPLVLMAPSRQYSCQRQVNINLCTFFNSYSNAVLSCSGIYVALQNQISHDICYYEEYAHLVFKSHLGLLLIALVLELKFVRLGFSVKDCPL